jgi:hypothetical protein
MNKLRTGRSINHNIANRKRNLARAVLLLADRREFDTILELRNAALYYGKLMSHYGFDMKSGTWDTKLFPITQNDREIEGINSDRLRFNDAVEKYNDYIIHLSKKYHLHDLEGSSTSFIVSFRPPSTNNQYKTNNNIQTRKRK